MIKEVKSGLIGILRGLNPFDMKCHLEYSLERNSNNKKLVDIEQKFRNSTRCIYYPFEYYFLNVLYAILNRTERMKR